MEVPAAAPSEGGIGARLVTVHVLGPDNPVDGVPLFVFWKAPNEYETEHNRTVLYALGLRSQHGTIVAHVPTDVTPWLVAGGDAWTEEWMDDIAPPGTAPVETTVRVYQSEVRGQLEGTWSPAAASAYHESAYGPVAWQPQDVLPKGSDTARAGYADRLGSITMSVNWTNGLTTQADLALAAYQAAGPTQRCLYQDAADQLGTQGAQTERFASEDTDTSFSCQNFSGLPPGDAVLMVGAATGRPAIMPLGLPYSVTYAIKFGYASNMEKLCAKLAGEYLVRFIDPATGEIYKESGRNAVSLAPVPGTGLPMLALALLAVAAVAASGKMRRHG